MKTSRRQLLAGATAGAFALGAPGAAAPKPGAPSTEEMLKGKKRSMPLDIKDYQPKSMLHVPESRVPRARYPVIDIHTHVSFSGGKQGAEEIKYSETPQNLLKVMDAKNLRALTNLTGGVGAGLRQSVERYDRAFPGRFYSFTEPWYSRASQPDYPKFQADELARARKDGAMGLKVLKTLGLYLRDKGKLVKVDDARFDPMWEQAGALKMPVCIHVADPEAFFLPTDRFNERFEELNNHPDWSFHGKDFPPFGEVIAALDRVMARHPKTQFVTLHVGCDAENLASVSERMDRYANMHVELGARIGELGRQPRAARKFFDRYQDRILFGTDAVPHGDDTPQQVYGELLYEIYFRFLETDDEYFDYAPAPVPPQGRWRIYGIALPDQVLRKVYNANAARLLGVKV